MYSRTRRLPIIALAALIMLFLTAGVAQAVPADVQNHWASAAVKNLMRQGILVGYPDRTFKPDRFVSRAEFARIAAKAFGLTPAETTPFSDAAKHWARKEIATLVQSGIIEGYPDGTFRPDKAITRAEMVAMLDRLMRVGTKEQVFGEDWTPSYPDVPKSHWAFRLVEIARRLDYLPPSYGTSFLPGAVVTRAETAWMVDKALAFGSKRGTVMEVNPEAGTVTVMPEDNGEPVAVQVDPLALILRNNAAATIEQVLVNDQLTTLTGPDGFARVVKATGKVNTNDLISRLSGLTKGLLTPDAAAAIARGDWSAAQDGLKSILFDRLIQMGLGPGEAQSLLDRDWLTLDLLSREKLVTALSSRLGLSTDVSAAILGRDLEHLKALLQSEVASLALGRLLQGQS
ncbi:MAG: S-layer homology domain-containing protein [Bacteroidota bacterium]